MTLKFVKRHCGKPKIIFFPERNDLKRFTWLQTTELTNNVKGNTKRTDWFPDLLISRT